MARTLAFVLLLVLATPVAWAQESIGNISTSVEPSELVVDYTRHVPRSGQEPPRQHVTVHVTAEIQCTPGTQPPLDPGIIASGQTRLTGGTADDQVTYMELKPTRFAAHWEDEGSGLYRIDSDHEVTVYSNATPPAEGRSEIRWNAAWAEQEGTTRCNPAGYGWAAEGEPHTIITPTIEGDPDPFPEPTGSNGIPLGAWVPLVALGVALALRRVEREE